MACKKDIVLFIFLKNIAISENRQMTLPILCESCWHGGNSHSTTSRKAIFSVVALVLSNAHV